MKKIGKEKEKSEQKPSTIEVAIILVAIIVILYLLYTPEKEQQAEPGSIVMLYPDKDGITVEFPTPTPAAEKKEADNSKVGIIINASMAPPPPTPAPGIIETKDGILRLSITGPDTVRENENFSVEFLLSTVLSPKIIGAGVDIAFDNYIKAISIDIAGAEDSSEDSSMDGQIEDKKISNVAIFKNNGINGRFLAVNFTAQKTGNATIKARILLSNEAMELSAPLWIEKTIKIV